MQIVGYDITKMEVDAIVNVAAAMPFGANGEVAWIGEAAGKLPCKYVINTVAPNWVRGDSDEGNKLRGCYFKSLELAKDMGCESVAVPLIRFANTRHPMEEELHIAVRSVSDFLYGSDMTVYLVVFDKSVYRTFDRRFSELSKYIRKKQDDFRSRLFDREIVYYSYSTEDSEPCFEPRAASQRSEVPLNSMPLAEALKCIDESFSEMLLRKIDEAGMTDAEVYKKANIDRKLFSKIRNDRLYKPRKSTAIAFAIALELSLEDTKELLMKAGFALSHSNEFDIIIEYFILNRNYNIFEINEALFAFDQCLLGA